MTGHTTPAIAEIINSHREGPSSGGGWHCVAAGCDWTWAESPLPMVEIAKHQADMIQKIYDAPVVASRERIAQILDAWGVTLNDDPEGNQKLIGELHALYAEPATAPSVEQSDLAQHWKEQARRAERAAEDAKRGWDKAEARLRELEAAVTELKPEPAAPSVEQIAEALRTAWRDDYSVRSIAEAIHDLYGTPGDAGGTVPQADLAQHWKEQARKAEARAEKEARANAEWAEKYGTDALGYDPLDRIRELEKACQQKNGDCMKYAEAEATAREQARATQQRLEESLTRVKELEIQIERHRVTAQEHAVANGGCVPANAYNELAEN